MNNGPGCTTNLDITDSGECQYAAKSLGFSGDVESANWDHAPKGCFVGHPDDHYKYLYFNSRSGETGRTVYKSICRIGKYATILVITRVTTKLIFI